jgi:hypothetical protein
MRPIYRPSDRQILAIILPTLAALALLLLLAFLIANANGLFAIHSGCPCYEPTPIMGTQVSTP